MSYIYRKYETMKVINTLKPTRSTPVKAISQSIDPSSHAEITISNTDTYSAVVITVKATYHSLATSGVRVRWLYSPNGVDFDSPEDAESAGNYEDLTFDAGKTRQRTILVPIFQPYVKIQIVNLDGSYPVNVDAWYTLMR